MNAAERHRIWLGPWRFLAPWWTRRWVWSDDFDWEPIHFEALHIDGVAPADQVGKPYRCSACEMGACHRCEGCTCADDDHGGLHNDGSTEETQPT